MQVQQVISQRLDVTLGRKRTGSGNYVDVITGPNGCGKTELLEVLLQYATTPEQIRWTSFGICCIAAVFKDSLSS